MKFSKTIMLICVAAIAFSACKNDSSDEFEEMEEGENVLKDYIVKPQNKAHGVADAIEKKQGMVHDRVSDYDE